MAGAKLISSRLAVCPVCGREARVIASTSAEVVSRCYACGDVIRTPHALRPAWSAESAVREKAGSGVHPSPAKEEPLAG